MGINQSINPASNLQGTSDALQHQLRRQAVREAAGGQGAGGADHSGLAPSGAQRRAKGRSWGNAG